MSFIENNGAAGSAPRWRAVTQVRMTRGLTALLGAVAVFVAGAGLGSAVASPVNQDQTATAERATSSGQWIANTALQYVGSPYVWAGNTPAGFDCSGFTQYVVLTTLGVDIGHDVAGQTGRGASVDWEAWQPGDLVFFAGTYRAGISHVGIYLGDGQFIHAENEATGVTISSLFSDYYSGHYDRAVRLV